MIEIIIHNITKIALQFIWGAFSLCCTLILIYQNLLLDLQQ